MDLAEAESLVLSFVPGRELTERDCAALRAVIQDRDDLRSLRDYHGRPRSVFVPSGERKAGRASTGSGA